MRYRKPAAPLGASLIVLSSVFYASYGIWTKLMGNFFGGYSASAVRSILVLILLLPIALFYGKLEPINLKRNWRSITGLLVASLFIWGPLYYAILHAGIGISLTINYACIVIGMFFFGWLIIHERFTKGKLVSATLGIIGLVLIYLPSLHAIGWLALGGAAISGLAASANMIITKQLPYNGTQSTLTLWAASVVANALMALLFHEKLPAISLSSPWVYLVIFSVASVIASWTFIRGLKLVDAGVAGILGLLEIVFAVLFGVLFFMERPGVVVLAGAIIIIGAATIPYLQEYRATKHRK